MRGVERACLMKLLYTVAESPSAYWNWGKLRLVSRWAEQSLMTRSHVLCCRCLTKGDNKSFQQSKKAVYVISNDGRMRKDIAVHTQR